MPEKCAAKVAQPVVDRLALRRDLLGVLGDLLLLPAEGDRLEHREQRDRRGDQDLVLERILEKIAVGQERGADRCLDRHEHDHDFRHGFELVPVGALRELAHAGAESLGVLREEQPALFLRVGFHGLEEGVERHLGVHRHDAALGQPHDHVGTAGLISFLLAEVDVLLQPAELDQPAQVHLAPAAAHRRSLQCLRECCGLFFKRILKPVQAVELRADGRIGALALRFQVAHVLVELGQLVLERADHAAELLLRAGLELARLRFELVGRDRLEGVLQLLPRVLRPEVLLSLGAQHGVAFGDPHVQPFDAVAHFFTALFQQKRMRERHRPRTRPGRSTRIRACR